ncbi:MAG TPA: hypothetical protein VGM88_07745 [Kofleriaceae bacterium]
MSFDEDQALYLRAFDDGQAIDALLLTVPASELRVVPELAVAGTSRGVAETPWSPELRARARIAALRRESFTAYVDIVDDETITMLVRHMTALRDALGAQSAIWRGRIQCIATIGEVEVLIYNYIRLVSMPEVPNFDVKVLASAEEAMEYEHFVATDPETVFDKPHLGVWTWPMSDAFAATGAVISPSPNAWVGSEPRPVTDLECQWLAVVAGALAMAVGEGSATGQDTTFEADGPEAHFAAKLLVTSREES